MFYVIEKKSIGGSDIWIGGIVMRNIKESVYIKCVNGLSKILSDDGRFIVSEDENNLYLKEVK